MTSLGMGFSYEIEYAALPVGRYAIIQVQAQAPDQNDDQAHLNSLELWEHPQPHFGCCNASAQREVSKLPRTESLAKVRTRALCNQETNKL